MRRKTRPIKQVSNMASACAAMIVAAAGFPGHSQEPAISDVRNDDEAPLSARERMERRRAGNPVATPAPAAPETVPTPPPAPPTPPAANTPAPKPPPASATPPAPPALPPKPATAPTTPEAEKKDPPAAKPTPTPAPEQAKLPEVPPAPAITPAANLEVVKEDTIEEKVTNPTVRPAPSNRYGKSVRHLSNVTRHYSSNHKAAKESIFDGKSTTSMAARFSSDLDVHVTVRASSEVIYDDNVFLSANNKVDSFVFIESLGINISLGDYESREGNYLAIDYAPAYVFYSADELDDAEAFAHQLLLEGQVVTGRWTFGAMGGFSKREGTGADTGAVEVNGRVDLTQFQAAINAKYDYSDRTFFLLSADYLDRDYEQHLDHSIWSVQGGVVTAILPKVQVGLSASYGEVDADERGQEEFQQILLTANYQPSGRVSLVGRAGVDLRQLAEGDDQAEFVFGLTAQHEVRDGTIVALEGHRNIEPSAVLPGQNAILTGLSVGLSQRLGDRFTFGVKGGYDHVTYQAAGTKEALQRDYDYFFVRPSLAFTGRWFDVELFYLFRDLDSDNDDFGFDNNQVGLKVGVTF